MVIIDQNTILHSGLLTAANALQWVQESFSLKYQARLPHKISITYGDGCFMNTMPCMLPPLGVFGVKVVTRFPQRTPSIAGDLLLYSEKDGQLLALMDATAITALRTGAVAALTVKTFAKSDFQEIGIMGLGATGRATLECLIELFKNKALILHLLNYKDHAIKTKEWLNNFHLPWQVDIVSGADSLIQHSDVIISCITVANGQIAQDEAFRSGCLLVPVHTRGFQNCDLFFDKVFADDSAHVENFRFFSKFKKFAEMPAVLNKTAIGRENDNERILCYNIGIAVHDIVFAHHLYRSISQ